MKNDELTDSQKALRGLFGAMLIGVLCIVVYAAQGKGGFLVTASVGILIAGASAFIGGALGFLFGIPRTLQQADGSPESGGDQQNEKSGSSANRIDYRVNTNLEQISDWLTKIIVGVGLTQITEIRNGLLSLTAFASKGLGSQGPEQVIVLALICYSTVLGFLFGYLWTRLFLAGALRVADQSAIGTLVAEVKKATTKAESTDRKLEELKKQSEMDAAALNLTYRQFNPGTDLPKVTQDELNAAVAAASRPVKVQIFNQAWQMRRVNWRPVKNKPKMELTIPIFKALIQSDSENLQLINVVEDS
jgi:hypothetical protein